MKCNSKVMQTKYATQTKPERERERLANNTMSCGARRSCCFMEKLFNELEWKIWWLPGNWLCVGWAVCYLNFLQVYSWLCLCPTGTNLINMHMKRPTNNIICLIRDDLFFFSTARVNLSCMRAACAFDSVAVAINLNNCLSILIILVMLCHHPIHNWDLRMSATKNMILRDFWLLPFYSFVICLSLRPSAVATTCVWKKMWMRMTVFAVFGY